VEEQREIVEHIARECEPLDATISRFEREIELLAEYRTQLVANTVTGKLDVREMALRLPIESNSTPDGLLADETDEADLTDEEAEA
jgi:type I restriction enzyme S subunit